MRNRLLSLSPSMSVRSAWHRMRQGSAGFCTRHFEENLTPDPLYSTDFLLLHRVRQEVRMRALRSLSGAGTGTTTPTAAEVPPGYVSAFDIIQETEREKDRVRLHTRRLDPA